MLFRVGKLRRRQKTAAAPPHGHHTTHTTTTSQQTLTARAGRDLVHRLRALGARELGLGAVLDLPLAADAALDRRAVGHGQAGADEREAADGHEGEREREAGGGHFFCVAAGAGGCGGRSEFCGRVALLRGVMGSGKRYFYLCVSATTREREKKPGDDALSSAGVRPPPPPTRNVCAPPASLIHARAQNSTELPLNKL